MSPWGKGFLMEKEPAPGESDEPGKGFLMEAGQPKKKAENKEGEPDKKLASLLERTKEAHHAYEQTLGHSDEDWARWYADYMLNNGEGELGNTNADTLRSLLIEAVSDYAAYQKKNGARGRRKQNTRLATALRSIYHGKY